MASNNFGPSRGGGGVVKIVTYIERVSNGGQVGNDRRAYGGPFSVRCGRKVRPQPFNNDLQFRSFSERHSFSESYCLTMKDVLALADKRAASSGLPPAPLALDS